jgi:superfamily II DNA or RNA helicase/HKD family nuclease/diadenosine tetraphosphate (Ap4A) HIT family hydrolase
MPSLVCPFCTIDSSRVFLRLTHVFAMWDGFPVTPGHALVVPHRHVATWFDASDEERAELFGAIEAVCAAIRATHGPVDDFNFGVNVGPAAGQTVPHLHLHVIPRRTGDMADPRGGVRHVIPSKGNYLAGGAPAFGVATDQGGSGTSLTARDAATPVAIRPAQPREPSVYASSLQLTTGESDPLLPQLERDLALASRVDIAVAFVMPSGVERLRPHFEDLLARQGTLRLLTGDYLDVSDPDALQRLVDLRTVFGDDRIQLRVFVTEGRSFHPKAYLLTRSEHDGVAYVGSSNLSASALTDGIEWNYRVQASREATGLGHVRAAFEALFAHKSTRPLDQAWLTQYRARRVPPAAGVRPAIELDTEAEAPAAIPTPNLVQQEALRALEATRATGNRAGLVVMATGLGKTWLAAFDIAREAFRRVLFVAHREEILSQALATFRRIRPGAMLGLYTGSERAPDADILFASIQTLSRREHLERFAANAFDYVIVDEFHHASAATYRRLIDHFDPTFLLGLTATPERSDGGDLLGLCGENLVYRCAVPRGIELELLCPYSYFGVPDDVDYRNIPWRSTRFDEDALNEAVATRRRAENILDQWRMRGGARTIAFCVSQRHADFMRAYFTEHGVPCSAVHSGATSDGRALSLERLAAGELRVVFAVDMINEGVDVPAIDTVMMLRPTESQIVWMQQFGRGLRKLPDKRLTVIDYIGNHRSFLVKIRSLLAIEARGGDRALLAALQAAQSSSLALPPGCEVTYELEAIEILKALLRARPDDTDALRDYYVDFKERHGQRPTASQAFHDGYLPRTARVGYGSWLGLVRAEGDLDPDALVAFEHCNAFLAGLDSTSMSKSYKMLVLLAMLNTDTLPGPGITIDALCDECARLARRTDALRAELGASMDNRSKLRALLVAHPIKAWTGSSAMPGVVPFRYEDQTLRLSLSVPDEARHALRELVREIADWRLAEYLRRGEDAEGNRVAGGFTMKVSHAGDRPILFLPDRNAIPGIPDGWTEVRIDGVMHRAKFVRIALNVVRRGDETKNVLPDLLRTWFGPDAGLPGTNYRVTCRVGPDGLKLKPSGVE